MNMSPEFQNPELTPPVDSQADPQQDPRQDIDLRYTRSSELLQGEQADTVLLSANTLREPVSFKAVVKERVLVRECLSALYDVVSGDFSYKPKDRSAYLAFTAMKKQTANAWEARQAYFDWIARNDPDAWLILDPVVSVYPDALSFEVFSKDEGAYAMASIKLSAFEIEGDNRYGTTNIDFSKDFAAAIQRLRSYRETRLDITHEQVAISHDRPTESDQTVAKQIKLPTSWLRGMLQVQSAGLMSGSRFSLAPMDLYNLLRHLRLNKDRKKGGRALRIELTPGQPPRLVLEPWNLVLTSTGPAYTGRQPQLVRLWGRRRLNVLARLLPLADNIEVHVLGSGLPAWFVITAGPVTFTLALTGFGASNWSQSLAFDLLLPDLSHSEDPSLKAVLAHLKQVRVASLEALSDSLKLSRQQVLAAVQSGCRQGLMMYDFASCRLRPLLDEPLPPEALRYRNRRERLAYDLLQSVNKSNAVSLTSEEHLHGIGIEIVGKVKVAADGREYRPLLRFNAEGRVLKADCSCPQFRKHQLKEGPCEHLMALRLLFGRLEIERRDNPDREHLRLETRSYSKRQADGSETVYQLALNERRFTKRWQLDGSKHKKHAMVYNSAADARDAYFAQIDQLEAAGFVDARS